VLITNKAKVKAKAKNFGHKHAVWQKEFLTGRGSLAKPRISATFVAEVAVMDW